MASPAKPPDPMPCALAALLLPESRARGCHVQETLFPEPALRASGGVRAQAVPARGVRSRGVREQREPGQRRGCAAAHRGWAASVGGATHSGWVASVGRVLLAARHACGGGVRVGVWRAGRRCVFQRCGVGHACALGLVRRPVALSGLLLRWPSGALDCCYVGRGWVAETFLTVRTLRVARS